MAPKKSRDLPNPVNVRLPEDLLDVMREEAVKAERTLSQEIRWRLLQSVSGVASRTMDQGCGEDSTTALSV